MTALTTPSSREIWIENLTGEMLLFGLLGRILFSPLEKILLQSIIDQDVFSESPFGKEHPDVQKGLSLLQKWTEANHPELTNEEFDNLRADMTGLFAGLVKVKAPPWESVHFSRNRLVYQERTMQVREWYRRFGLVVEFPNVEPDDHIGLELAFLAHLAKMGIQSLEESDNTYKPEQLLNAQKAFLQEHLLCWVFKWQEQVQAHAKTVFYQGLGLLVRGAVLHLAGLLEIQVIEEIG